MSADDQLRFGICKPIACNYLPEQVEQLLVLADDSAQAAEHYAQLLGMGFRRCGDTLYRPHCPACHACLPLRIEPKLFCPSKSQRRLQQRAHQFAIRWLQAPSQDYFPLYERYINQRHADSSMAPATRTQYQEFIGSSWATTYFLEIWDQQQLISVSVTDVTASALSAVYTFYDPGYQSVSIGTMAILAQLEYALHNRFQYLYLGFQIDGCAGMDYKRRFKPYQILTRLGWQKFNG